MICVLRFGLKLHLLSMKLQSQRTLRLGCEVKLGIEY